jgi:paraquat-inducible protein A
VNTTLTACRECDLVQRKIVLSRDNVALCSRCGATLYRNHLHSIEHTLALTAGAIVFFVIANAFPIVGLQLQGQLIETTLFNTVSVLYSEHSKPIAALVFVTAIAMPALELMALTYVLLPLRMGRVPPYYVYVLRMLQVARPWNMVEIFMLGVLVSVVKLADTASIVVGNAAWALAALMMVMAAVSTTLDARALWAKATPER